MDRKQSIVLRVTDESNGSYTFQLFADEAEIGDLYAPGT